MKRRRGDELLLVVTVLFGSWVIEPEEMEAIVRS